MLTISIFISMYLLHFIQKKIMVNDSHSQTTVFIYKCRLRCRGTNLQSPREATKYLLGQKHIFDILKRSASNGTIFNWKFRLEICLIFFKTSKYFPALVDVLCFGVAKVRTINTYNPIFGAIRSPINLKVVLILKDFAHGFHLYQF